MFGTDFPAQLARMEAEAAGDDPPAVPVGARHTPDCAQRRGYESCDCSPPADALCIVGDLSGITGFTPEQIHAGLTVSAVETPTIIPSESQVRDIADIAGTVSQLAVTLAWAGRGMGNAHAEGADQRQARDAWLETLRRAYADLSELIGYLAEDNKVKRKEYSR